MASRSATAGLVAVIVPLTAAAALALTGAFESASAGTTSTYESPAAAHPSGPKQPVKKPAAPASDPATSPAISPATPSPIEPAATTPPANPVEVRELQRRLTEAGMYGGPITGIAGPLTQAAVSRFQASVGLPVLGTAGPHTWARLRAMTEDNGTGDNGTGDNGTGDNGTGDNGTGSKGSASIDPRCLAPGKVICVDKTKRTLRKMADGVVLGQADARFGPAGMATREGTHAVFSKSRDHVSSIYKTKMPYALFFSGGQAVHFSPDFAANGYNGASHGCINLRSRSFASALFDWAEKGTTVVVYRS